MHLRSQEPTADQKAARGAVIDALRSFGHMPPHDLLGVLAYTVGQMVALQDQTKMTAEEAMEIVARNIENGNRDVIDGLRNAVGGQA